MHTVPQSHFNLIQSRCNNTNAHTRTHSNSVRVPFIQIKLREKKKKTETTRDKKEMSGFLPLFVWGRGDERRRKRSFSAIKPKISSFLCIDCSKQAIRFRVNLPHMTFIILFSYTKRAWIGLEWHGDRIIFHDYYEVSANLSEEMNENGS